MCSGTAERPASSFHRCGRPLTDDDYDDDGDDDGDDGDGDGDGGGPPYSCNK